LGAIAGARVSGVTNTLAFGGRRGQRTNRPWRKSGGTQRARQPKAPEGAKSEPTGMGEGSRSNAQYRGAGEVSCPEAWGTEAQGTHDNNRRDAGRQCRA
jgi:hypothetical protein